jgi:hypothetical protein
MHMSVASADLYTMLSEGNVIFSLVLFSPRNAVPFSARTVVTLAYCAPLVRAGK